MANILEKIVAVKREEVAHAMRSKSLAQVQKEAQSRLTTRDFVTAMRNKIAVNEYAVIAEIKKASPSKGVIREDFVPADIAQSYAEHGAACLSVLTDEQFFQGSADYLKQARASCPLPVLRKDFIIDTYQIYESRAMGADCVLLIVACLSNAQLLNLACIAHELQMAVLIEAHDVFEMNRAVAMAQALQRPDKTLIGVNNRNLQTFEVSLQTTLDLRHLAPEGLLVVTESGVNDARDVQYLRMAGLNSFLIGEALMRKPSPGEGLRELFSPVAPE